MKKILLLLTAAAAISCGKEAPAYPGSEGPAQSAGKGRIALDLTVAPILDAETRAAQIPLSSIGITAPDANLLRVLIACKNRDIVLNGNNPYEAYNSVTVFNSAEKEFEPADYFLTLGSTKAAVPAATRNALPHYTTAGGQTVTNVEAPYHADRERGTLIPQIGEGENLPYYEATGTVTVTDGETATASLTARLANAVVCVDFTDAFKHYFENGARIRIDTKALVAGSSDVTTCAGSFVVDAPKWSAYAKRYFFVRPNQPVTLSGTALRQDPSPDMGLNKEVVLSGYTSVPLAPQTLYTFRFDIAGVGSSSGKIVVTLNDEPVGTIDEEIELNPNAPKN